MTFWSTAGSCTHLSHVSSLLYPCSRISQQTAPQMLLLLQETWAATWQNQQNECAPSRDSYQPGHPPSLIRVFAVLMKKPCVLSYPLSAQRRLWSDWADAQADLSLRWAHTHFVGFVMSRLKSKKSPHCLFWKFASVAGEQVRVLPDKFQLFP